MKKKFLQEYIGEFHSGKSDGYGTLKITRDKFQVAYSGQFKNGLIHGFGKLEGSYDGMTCWRYVGEFIDGLRHGHGILTVGDDNEVPNQRSYSYTGAWLYD